MHRFLPPAVFVVVSAIGLGMTAVVHNAEETAIRTRFEVVADEVVDRLRERVTQHVAFLVATHSFFVANGGTVSKNSFAAFIDGLDLKTRFVGMQGVGYARMIAATKQAEAEIATTLSANYGINRQVWPETDQETRTPIVLLEPNDERNERALGYDMYADGVRRAAMQRAAATSSAQASAPVKLVQENGDDPQSGFLVYIPIQNNVTPGENAATQGFVYAPFRAGDLHRVALNRFPKPPVVVQTVDNTDDRIVPLFQSTEYEKVAAGSALTIERPLEIAGRRWMLTIHESPEFSKSTSKLGTFALGAISLLLAAALAISTRSQFNAVRTARELHAVSEKSLQDKDLMLQEMKHRIKNSIARVLAMARQTATHAESIDEFTTSFSARLQAMANAQDMLTRSHWERADLRELLGKELEQVFGKSLADSKVSGPKVHLNERATQALGLTFHELATNAVKYGGISSEEGELSVHWHLEGSGKNTTLVINWVESSGTIVEEPGKAGFGTRLIDANIKGEMGGTIERSFSADGMSIRITMPIS